MITLIAYFINLAKPTVLICNENTTWAEVGEFLIESTPINYAISAMYDVLLIGILVMVIMLYNAYKKLETN